jgi:hypothetical protein
MKAAMCIPSTASAAVQTLSHSRPRAFAVCAFFVCASIAVVLCCDCRISVFSISLAVIVVWLDLSIADSLGIVAGEEARVKVVDGRGRRRRRQRMTTTMSSGAR